MIDTVEYNRPSVEELAAKYAEIEKLRWRRPEGKRIPVYQGVAVVAVGERTVYKCIRDAAKAHGVSDASVRRSVADGRLAGGKQWVAANKRWMEANPTKVAEAKYPVNLAVEGGPKKPVTVIYADGSRKNFPSVGEAARAAGMSERQVGFRLKTGRPDRHGRVWMITASPPVS